MNHRWSVSMGDSSTTSNPRPMCNRTFSGLAVSSHEALRCWSNSSHKLDARTLGEVGHPRPAYRVTFVTWPRVGLLAEVAECAK